MAPPASCGWPAHGVWVFRGILRAEVEWWHIQEARTKICTAADAAGTRRDTPAPFFG